MDAGVRRFRSRWHEPPKAAAHAVKPAPAVVTAPPSVSEPAAPKPAPAVVDAPKAAPAVVDTPKPAPAVVDAHKRRVTFANPVVVAVAATRQPLTQPVACAVVNPAVSWTERWQRTATATATIVTLPDALRTDLSTLTAKGERLLKIGRRYLRRVNELAPLDVLTRKQHEEFMNLPQRVPMVWNKALELADLLQAKVSAAAKVAPGCAEVGEAKIILAKVRNLAADCRTAVSRVEVEVKRLEEQARREEAQNATVCATCGDDFLAIDTLAWHLEGGCPKATM